MKMKLSDITSKRPLPSICRSVTQLEPVDPVAQMYRRVRDAIVCDAEVATGIRIGILELVKAELVRDMQAQIDEG